MAHICPGRKYLSSIFRSGPADMAYAMDRLLFQADRGAFASIYEQFLCNISCLILLAGPKC